MFDLCVSTVFELVVCEFGGGCSLFLMHAPWCQSSSSFCNHVCVCLICVCLCVFDLCVLTVFELVVCEFGGGAHCF